MTSATKSAPARTVRQEPGLAARQAAVGLVSAVLRDGASLNDCFAAGLNGAGRAAALAALDQRDLAFARQVAATTLRRLGQIDAMLGHCLKRPLPKTAAFIVDVLRIGGAQLLFLKTPAHAVVDSSVRLAEKQPGAFKGLVNGVLRRISRESDALRTAYHESTLNTPEWMRTSWRRSYGDDVTNAIARAHLADPPLDMTLKEAEAAPRWAQQLEAKVLPTATLRRQTGGRIEDLPGFAEGAWWVQDVAAALPARILASGLRAVGKEGASVLDLCAAPGGKTAQLAAAGFDVTAVDISKTRLTRVRENLDRLGLTAELVAADGMTFRPGRTFEGILVDAPCTATGTLRRRPDVAHLKDQLQLAGLAKLQYRLLKAACALLAPGGLLVYAVCSLQPEECEAQIERLLNDANGGLSRLPVTPGEIGGLAECIADSGDLRTLPCHLKDDGGMDGFYAARLVKAF